MLFSRSIKPMYLSLIKGTENNYIPNENNLALLNLTGNKIQSVQPGFLYFLEALIKLDL